MWFTGEEGDDDTIGNKIQDYGYVYEFEVVKPIKVDKIINFITQHPTKNLGSSICKIYGNVCAHPQITLRYPSQRVYDLSIEITLPLKKFLNEGYIKLIKRYRTNLKNLEEFNTVPLRDLAVHRYGDILFFYRKDKDVDKKYLDKLVK
jgi:hypothetical protein